MRVILLFVLLVSCTNQKNKIIDEQQKIKRELIEIEPAIPSLTIEQELIRMDTSNTTEEFVRKMRDIRDTTTKYEIREKILKNKQSFHQARTSQRSKTFD